MFAKTLCILFAIPFIVQLVSAQSCSRTYTVQENDDCDSISAANNASTYQLAVVNQGTIDAACDNLQAGESICLGWDGEDCTNTYVVALGNTCDGVAWNFGINDTMLYANNPQLNSDCTNLYVGEVVCVASTVLVPPAPSNGYVPASAIPATATPAPTDIPYCD